MAGYPFPYPPIFTGRGRGQHPGAQYPQQGQIPIFTPPILPPGMSSGASTAGGSNEPYYTAAASPQAQAGAYPNPQAQPPMTMPDGSAVDPQDNIRQMTPEEQARYAPDMASRGTQQPSQPQQHSGLRRVFDNITSAPNASVLLTLGSILSSAPHQGESPLGQAVRGINGAYSTYGLFAQQKQAQQEAQRKARLEQQKANDESLRTASTVVKNREGTRQEDRKIDATEVKNEADIALDKAKQADLKQYRSDRLTQQTKQLAQADKQIEIAEKRLKQEASNHEDTMNMEGRKNQLKEEHDKAVNDRELARIAIQRTRTEKDLDTLKMIEVAQKLAEHNAPLNAVSWTKEQLSAFFDQQLAKVKAEKAQAKGTPGAAAPPKVLTDAQMRGGRDY